MSDILTLLPPDQSLGCLLLQTLRVGEVRSWSPTRELLYTTSVDDVDFWVRKFVEPVALLQPVQGNPGKLEPIQVQVKSNTITFYSATWSEGKIMVEVGVESNKVFEHSVESVYFILDKRVTLAMRASFFVRRLEQLKWLKLKWHLRR